MALSRYIPSSMTAFEMAREGRRKEQAQKIRGLALMAEVAQRQQRIAQSAAAAEQKQRQFEAEQKRPIPVSGGYITQSERGPKFTQTAAAKEPKAPTTRTRIEGDKKIVEEFDPVTRTFKKISEGPRYKPTTEINMGEKSIPISELKNWANDKGENPPPTISVAKAWELGFRPKKSASERKAETAAAESKATIGRVEQRVMSMINLLEKNWGIVGIPGKFRQWGEALAGSAPGAGDMETPALDYQNQLSLLLADVRKMVEKDPNLSKDERENLIRTLGGGALQTSGSAYRALTDALNYIKGKLGTPQIQMPSSQQAPSVPKIGDVQKGYRFLGGDPSNPKSWEKVR